MQRVYDALALFPRFIGSLSFPKFASSGAMESNDITLNVVGDEASPSKKILDIIDNLDTLDVMLFNGQNYWFSYVVEWATWSQFSHIGLVLKSPTWLHPSLTGNYLLESGSESTPDAIDHKIKFGVQITPLETLLENYVGKIYYRKINSLPLKENPQYYHNKIKDIHTLIQDKPYDDSGLDLIAADLRVKLGNCQRTNAFFCSALVGFIFTQLGFLPADTQWDLITPKDFAGGYKMEEDLKRHNLCELGPMILIT